MKQESNIRIGEMGPDNHLLTAYQRRLWVEVDRILYQNYLTPRTVTDFWKGDDVAMERGQVAVVVSNVGKEPVQIRKLVDDAARQEHVEIGSEAYRDLEKRFAVGIERYVVPKGYRGIQQEVAGLGIYYLNRRAFIAYIIDTTNITIDWDDSKETRFDPLKVVSRDGFEISVSVKVVIRVRPDQAPYLVAKIGSIENLNQQDFQNRQGNRRFSISTCSGRTDIVGDGSCDRFDISLEAG